MSTSALNLDPEELKRNLAITLGTQGRVLPEHLGMPSEPQMAGPIAPAQGKPPDLAIAQPSVKGPRGTLDADKAERSRLLDTGSGISQIYNKVTNSSFGQNHPLAGKILGGLGEGAATLGNIGLSAVAPQVSAMIPGTQEHHQLGLRQINRQIGNEEGEQEKEAQTANLQSQPELHQAQLELGQNKLDETERQHDQQLREHGFKVDEKGQMVPLPYAEMSEQQQAVQDLKGSQEELADASAALKKAQADPNSPQARIAQQRLEGAQQARQIALQRLGLSQQVFDARYKGVDEQGQALPGAMISDSGQPVGSSFSQNVRPTGSQRNKGNMAESADQQIADMKDIVAKRPDVFGPAAGRKTDFTVWVGSQDPDAQRFRAARTIAGDHLAGTFGGRSEAALTALDNAIGQFKDNPAAVTAGLNQLQEANRLFLKAGKVKTAGSKENAPAQASTFKVKLSDAMALPQNKGKSESDVEADVKKHGGEVVR